MDDLCRVLIVLYGCGNLSIGRHFHMVSLDYRGITLHILVTERQKLEYLGQAYTNIRSTRIHHSYLSRSMYQASMFQLDGSYQVRSTNPFYVHLTRENMDWLASERYHLNPLIPRRESLFLPPPPQDNNELRQRLIQYASIYNYSWTNQRRENIINIPGHLGLDLGLNTSAVSYMNRDRFRNGRLRWIEIEFINTGVNVLIMVNVQTTSLRGAVEDHIVPMAGLIDTNMRHHLQVYRTNQLNDLRAQRQQRELLDTDQWSPPLEQSDYANLILRNEMSISNASINSLLRTIFLVERVYNVVNTQFNTFRAWANASAAQLDRVNMVARQMVAENEESDEEIIEEDLPNQEDE